MNITCTGFRLFFFLASFDFFVKYIAHVTVPSERNDLNENHPKIYENFNPDVTKESRPRPLANERSKWIKILPIMERHDIEIKKLSRNPNRPCKFHDDHEMRRNFISDVFHSVTAQDYKKLGKKSEKWTKITYAHCNERRWVWAENRGRIDRFRLSKINFVQVELEKPFRIW